MLNVDLYSQQVSGVAAVGVEIAAASCVACCAGSAQSPATKVAPVMGLLQSELASSLPQLCRTSRKHLSFKLEKNSNKLNNI